MEVVVPAKAGGQEGGNSGIKYDWLSVETGWQMGTCRSTWFRSPCSGWRSSQRGRRTCTWFRTCLPCSCPKARSRRCSRWEIHCSRHLGHINWRDWPYRVRQIENKSNCNLKTANLENRKHLTASGKCFTRQLTSFFIELKTTSTFSHFLLSFQKRKLLSA